MSGMQFRAYYPKQRILLDCGARGSNSRNPSAARTAFIYKTLSTDHDTEMSDFLQRLVIGVATLLLTLAPVRAQPASSQLSLTQAQASHFAALAMKCIQKEYPNK